MTIQYDASEEALRRKREHITVAIHALIQGRTVAPFVFEDELLDRIGELGSMLSRLDAKIVEAQRYFETDEGEDA